MTIKTETSSTSTDSTSASSALSPLSTEGLPPVVDSPGVIAVPAPASVGVDTDTDLTGGPDGESSGLEKDLEALDLKVGSEGHPDGNRGDVEKEHGESSDETDSEQQLRRYARDLTRYHRILFDNVKSRDQKKRT